MEGNLKIIVPKIGQRSDDKRKINKDGFDWERLRRGLRLTNFFQDASSVKYM